MKQQKTSFYLLDLFTEKFSDNTGAKLCHCKIHFKSYTQKLHSVSLVLVNINVKKPLKTGLFSFVRNILIVEKKTLTVILLCTLNTKKKKVKH